ncbi:MAG: sigma-70 family RNA polymerase sigma factor [Synergistaceae bacterium]|nr:sigma-70 family RNA polymerase sigma factor [Synergistaceae bacterium]
MTTTINNNYDEKKLHANAAAVATAKATTRRNAGARATAKTANDANVSIIGFIGLPGITDDTTLNELIALARNNAIEKPKTTPKFATLRNKCRLGECHCIASLKNSMFDLRVYDCGYAGYESYGRTTVIDLDEIFTVMYPSNYYEVSLEASAIGNSSWGYALAILGDEQIEIQQNKEKAHDFVSEDDNGSVSADAYDLGCVCDCGGLSGSKKINQPALAVHIDDPETAYIKKETKAEIRWALSKTRTDMTEKQAEVFRLYYDEDMTLKEIAKTLGISSPAVLYRLEGVSKKLHKNMEQFL